MLKDENNILHNIATKAEWSNGLVTNVQLNEPSDSKSSFKYFIAKNAFKENVLNGNTDIDAIYFNDIAPVVYIKSLSEYKPEEIIKLHNRFWNEGRTPLTLIITPKTIKILDNFSKPVNSTNSISSIELKEYSNSEADLKRLAKILHQSKLDSDNVIGKSLIIKTEQRVDKKLIEQLRYAREALYNNFGLDFGTIHDLLGRSLFTLYLEHRNILTKEDIKLETGVEKDFFELLNEYPAQTYKLFKFLKEKFNGDLFPISKKEEEAVNNNPGILKVIYDCYTGERDLKKGQLGFFRLFDFKHIPIELISAIYEEFMSEEDNSKNKIINKTSKSKKDLGAFYTPQMLVEFVYNEILPMPSKADHNCNIKILDPTCGSGIFLVEGYKRLIERWKFTHKTETLDKDILLKILKDNIYGVELHPEAIKITAFSLYLTFLQYINPRDILRKVSFETLIYWTESIEDKDFENRKNKNFGENLLRASTFIREEENYDKNQVVEKFFDTKFDLIVGNPPWKRSNVDSAIIGWAEKNGWEVKKDIVKAFLAYSPTISPDATIALISSAKSILFNTSGTEDDFRIKFFKNNKISVIVNFAVVRDVLFEKAKQASALVIYKNRKEEEIDLVEDIIYVTPKTKSSIKNRKNITIDASEIKSLPISEIVKPNSKIFKIAMYGGLRDLKFITMLNSFPKISDIKNIDAVGLNNDTKSNNKGNPRLGDNIFIDSKSIKPYYIPNRNKQLFKTHPKFEILRTIKKDIFSPPLIAIKIGNDEIDICSAYIDYNCAFETYALGLKFPEKSVNYHKAFVCCLNSSLARYYYLLISGSWGVDRGRVQRNELLQFPLITEKFSEQTINLLAEKLDYIIEVKNKELSNQHNEEIEINTVSEQIDLIIYKSLNLSDSDIFLIDNVVNYSNIIKSNYQKVNAENIITSEYGKKYLKTYVETINKHFKNSNIKLKAELFSNSLNDELVCMKFYFDKSNSDIKSIEENNTDIKNILKEINEYSFENNNSSIYYRKFIKYELKNSFYLIKPNQKRFWTSALALNDADDLIVEILNQSTI